MTTVNGRSPQPAQMDVNHFTDARIAEIYASNPPMTKEERAFLARDTATFECCDWSTMALFHMSDSNLMRAAYDVWAEYARDMS